MRLCLTDKILNVVDTTGYKPTRRNVCCQLGGDQHRHSVRRYVLAAQSLLHIAMRFQTIASSAHMPDQIQEIRVGYSQKYVVPSIQLVRNGSNLTPEEK